MLSMMLMKVIDGQGDYELQFWYGLKKKNEREMWGEKTTKAK